MRKKLGEQIPYSPEAKVSIAVDDTGEERPGSSALAHPAGKGYLCGLFADTLVSRGIRTPQVVPGELRVHS